MSGSMPDSAACGRLPALGLLLLCVCFTASTIRADEGMRTFDSPPLRLLQD